MTKKLLALLSVLALSLSGCSSEAPAEIQPTATSSTTTPAETAEPIVGYEAAIRASYAKLYETGMTESVTSAGDRYILSYSPSEEFVAGLYNVEIDDVILVDEELFFTVASAFRALEDPATVITETENGVALSNPNFGDFTVVIQDGLVVSGFDNGGSWTGEFSYQPDEKVTQLVAELQAAEG